MIMADVRLRQHPFPFVSYLFARYVLWRDGSSNCVADFDNSGSLTIHHVRLPLRLATWITQIGMFTRTICSTQRRAQPGNAVLSLGLEPLVLNVATLPLPSPLQWRHCRATPCEPPAFKA